MVSKSQDIDRLTLMVMRLMDADVLPPIEGNALLKEIEALTQTSEEAAKEGETENTECLPQALSGVSEIK